MKAAWAFLILPWFSPLGAWGLLPFQSFQDLAAGGSTIPGYRDGPFYSALFHNPQGLAFNPEGTLLYVADRDNNCIRVIDREHGNQVSTLAGDGKPGYKDGAFPVALFNQPAQLVYLPGHRLVVFDSGNFRLRLIDLDHKTVSTLAGNGTQAMTDGPALQASISGMWSMVYLPSRDGLYFSGNGALRKLDLKSGNVLTVFRDKTEIPLPGALAVDKDRLYVANQDVNGKVYQLTPEAKFAKEDASSFDWTPISQGNTIFQMAWSDGTLYAVQREDFPILARLTPQYQPVAFVTLWGDTLDQGIGLTGLLGGAAEGGPRFVAADPLSPRKLYFTHPGSNLVTSYRDLHLQELKDAESVNPDGLTDFLYPTTKPPGTFRILVIGDSHTFHQYDEDKKKHGWDKFNRFATISKRAEEALNVMAALKDVPWHFEVLHYGEVSGNHLALWPYYAVPPLVKKFDVDLVVDLFSPNFDLSPFYDYPYTPEGIPTEKQDNEFLLKPADQKIQSGLPRELFELLKAKNLAWTDHTRIQFADLSRIAEIPEARDKAAKLTARPTMLLREKLNSIKTSEGKPVQLEMALLPLGRFDYQTAETEVFWDEFFREINAPTLDLFSPMNALRLSFYPFSQVGGYDHFNADGHLLMGLLLAEELIDHKLVPFEPPKK